MSYEDIINLPHHVSTVHPQMAVGDRAAQFSPFAALTGYEEAIQETERLTDEKIELDEDIRQIINTKLTEAKNRLKNQPESPRLTITYFRPDSRKAGGSYVTVTGAVKKIDEYERILEVEDQSKTWKISMEWIIGIED